MFEKEIEKLNKKWQELESPELVEKQHQKGNQSKCTRFLSALW